MTISNLLQLCHPLFSLAEVFRNPEKMSQIDISYRDSIIKEFDGLERQAFSLQIDSHSIQHIKFALAALLDELVMSSNWEYKQTWMTNPLQLELFGEHLAGEVFFGKLSALRQSANQNIDVLEIYYLCLQLGFEGKYRLQDMEKLMALQVDLRSQIDMAKGVIEPQLSPGILVVQSVIQQVSHNVPFWIILSITAAIIFFTFIGYSYAIDQQANLALSEIQNTFAGAV